MPIRTNPSRSRNLEFVRAIASHQLVVYLFVGLFNTLVGFGIIFACMYLLGIGPVLSNVIGYLCGLVVSYVLNKRFTFKSTSKSKLEALRFLAVFLFAYGANLLALILAINWLELHDALAQVIASTVYVATSFLLNKYYTFAEPRR